MMRIRYRRLIRLIESIVEDELNTIEVGDLVDVDTNEDSFSGVRVVELVDDVNSVAGDPDLRDPSSFYGPGFVGETRDGDELVFSLRQVVPGSKASYFFPSSVDR